MAGSCEVHDNLLASIKCCRFLAGKNSDPLRWLVGYKNLSSSK
jgi:hypothetical protein